MNFKALTFTSLLFLTSIVKVFSQEQLTVFKQEFETYNNVNYQEKVFLHTDKTVYSTGEIIWFKAYVTNANSNNFSWLSSICYVEIINADMKPLLQAKISIDSGKGNGSFILPSYIRSGNYLIRAYTNWMKNFDPSFYFEQPITIINTSKKPQVQDTINALKYSLQFFPEGGNMVYGMDNTIAFKLTDKFNRGVQGKGKIVNEKNEPVQTFETGQFGMGSFLFSPLKGNKYHAIVQLNGQTVIRDLPEIYNTGWVLHAKNDGDNILIHVRCNIETEHNVFLLAQTRDSIKFINDQYLKNGSADFTIKESDLGEGISQLTLFNEKKQPVCERLYFKKPTHLLQIKQTNLQQDYQQRKKISISVSTSDVNTKTLEADMSVAVYLADSLQPLQNTNLLNYLWLSSDLKGLIESPEYYFENSGSAVDEATNNLMLTQGWRRFKWEDVLNNSKPSFSFLPEHDVHIITGKLIPKFTGLPVKGINAYLSVEGKDFKFSNSTASEQGYLKFNVDKFYGTHEIMAQTSLADSNYRILLDNPFSDKFYETKIESLNLKQNLKNTILLRSVGAQAQNSYQPEKKNNFIMPVYDTTGFYGIPSKTYYLDDYTRFPTMEEVMREYVKEVHVRVRQKDFHYDVFNEPEQTYFSSDPLVLIDGIPAFDINKIINVDPLKIRKVDIITNVFFQGSQQFNGIVSYSTYRNDLEGYQLDPNTLVIEYEGLQLQREFYSPQYESVTQATSHIPDYRNVLYWLPDLKTVNGNREISFYTSDIPGKYIIMIQGISKSGLAGVSATTFNVTDLVK